MLFRLAGPCKMRFRLELSLYLALMVFKNTSSPGAFVTLQDTSKERGRAKRGPLPPLFPYSFSLFPPLSLFPDTKKGKGKGKEKQGAISAPRDFLPARRGACLLYFAQSQAGS